MASSSGGAAALAPPPPTAAPAASPPPALARASPAPAGARLPGADLLSVAPMMEWTSRHYRFLARLLTRRTLLYTEMVVDNTLLFSELRDGWLRFHPAEHPIACQLGGSQPASLAAAARLVEAAGYDEINLNCGCPSAKVAGRGTFGARLMFTPELVRDCVAAMRAAVAIPVSVKCRLGADQMDSYEAFANFVRVVAQSGCDRFVVHARKCVLKGLTPKDNRTIPPLRYEWVQRLALELPHVRVSLNGGVGDMPTALQLLALERAGGGGCDGGGDGGREGGADRVAGAGAMGDSVGSDAGERALAAGCCDDDALDCAEEERAHGAAPPPCDEAAGDGVAQQLAGVSLGHSSSSDSRGISGGERGGSSGDGGGAAPPLPAAWPAAPWWPVHAGCALPPAPPPPASFGTPSRVLASVMIGRAAYNQSWLLATADSQVFGVPDQGLSRRQVIAAYLDYCDGVVDSLPPPERRMSHYRPFEMVKPLLGLFHGVTGGGRFRNALTLLLQEQVSDVKEATGCRVAPVPAQPGATVRAAVTQALSVVPPFVLDEVPGPGGAAAAAAAARLFAIGGSEQQAAMLRGGGGGGQALDAAAGQETAGKIS